MDSLAQAYIDKGPPFLGDSGFRAKSIIKEAGAKWQKEKKKWSAGDVPTLCRLIDTGVWMPVGLSRGSLCVFRTSSERRMRSRKRRREKARRVNVEGGRAGKSRGRRASAARLGVPPNESDLMQKVLSHGVTAELVAESACWSFLGPRSGISDVRRLIRGVSLGVVDWKEIASGDARVRNTRAEPQKSTGAGARDAGVKRRRRQGARTLEGARQADKQSRLEPLQTPWQQRWQPPAVYCYTATCEKCHSTLDSQCQFGLECACGELWTRCCRCFMPMRSGVHCAACA